jgi:hypothetical protein
VLDVPADEVAHSALIRQRTVPIEASEARDDVEVLSRFNPVVAPWSAVASALFTRSAATRVRATVMPTEVAVTDRLGIDAELAKARTLLEASRDRVDVRNSAERAIETLVDLGASLSSPALCVEIAVASSEPLEELFVRHLGSCFTSETGVVRQRGQTVVAGQRVFLGGFDIERQPRGLGDALRLGLPLRGGVGARGLVDLITLTECPLGWPVPAGGPVPTIGTDLLRRLPAPRALREGIAVGSDAGGEQVCLPTTALARHAFVCGRPGRESRPF